MAYRRSGEIENSRKRLGGGALGLWSLRLDAAYCLLLGAFVAIAAPSIANVLPLPTAVIAGVGVVVVVWSALVVWMVMRLRLRLALRLVLGVNVVAAALIAAVSLTAASAPVLIAVLAVALDVALFAFSQLVSLRRLKVDLGSTVLV